IAVTPGNMFPLLAQENGAALIIVNHHPTPLDPYADHLIHDRNIKELLTEWNALLSLLRIEAGMISMFPPLFFSLTPLDLLQTLGRGFVETVQLTLQSLVVSFPRHSPQR